MTMYDQIQHFYSMLKRYNFMDFKQFEANHKRWRKFFREGYQTYQNPNEVFSDLLAPTFAQGSMATVDVSGKLIYIDVLVYDYLPIRVFIRFNVDEHLNGLDNIGYRKKTIELLRKQAALTDRLEELLQAFSRPEDVIERISAEIHQLNEQALKRIIAWFSNILE